MFRMLRVLLRKEFLQISRDRVILRMLFLMPMVQLLVLANAATFEVKVAQLWRGRPGPQHVVAPRHRPAFAAAAVSFRWGVRRRLGPADAALIDGAADLVLVIPQGFRDDPPPDAPRRRSNSPSTP